MLFLDVIISFTQITGREGPGIPCCGFKTQGVDTQSETDSFATLFEDIRLCQTIHGRKNMGSQFCSFSLKMYDRIRPSMAE
jgi:hypothetical protein